MRNRRPQTSIFIYGWRLGLVAVGLVCLFIAIYARLYYLHVERSEQSLEATYKARQLLDKVPARRGNIVDAKDNLLATSRPVITLGVDPERVELDAEGSLPEAPVPDYADETVSTKVVKIIQSYTGVVNKMVWRKY